MLLALRVTCYAVWAWSRPDLRRGTVGTARARVSDMKLWRVIAQGRVIAKLGRTSWSKREATEMVRDLRNRGYADAHKVLL